MELVLATGNSHKRSEFNRILSPHRILCPEDLGLSFAVEEIGKTYLENALIKAEALLGKVDGRPIIADDSGLSVPALGDAPGIYSARYGSKDDKKNLNDFERNAFLLEKMRPFKGEERQAFFLCCLVLQVDKNRLFVVQESFLGRINHAPIGLGGFGYDPLFYVPSHGKTVAQLETAEKNRLSHRGKAGLRMRILLQNLENLA